MCKHCGKEIKTVCFLGTDHCSTNCLKAMSGEGLIPDRSDV